MAYREAERFWAGLDSLNEQDIQELDRYLEDNASIRPRIRHPDWRRLAAMAATVLLVTATGLWATTVWLARGDYRAATGQQQTVTLADGSTLKLNTDTAISVALKEDIRRLLLHRGEAFFTVAPDAVRPFEVSAGGGTIRALGTAFHVRTDAARVTVTVTEHSVRVMTHGANATDVRTGERLTYGADGPIGDIQQVDITRTLAWQRHRLIFENQPLAEVLEELARYRSGWILLHDPSLRSLPVTGVFNTERPDHIFPVIEQSLPIRTVKLTDQLMLLHRDHTKRR